MEQMEAVVTAAESDLDGALARAIRQLITGVSQPDAPAAAAPPAA